jgi:hypothetical protein
LGTTSSESRAMNTMKAVRAPTLPSIDVAAPLSGSASELSRVSIATATTSSSTVTPSAS